MDFSYRDYFDGQPHTGYERLLYDCMLGDATLFQRADRMEAHPTIPSIIGVSRIFFGHYLEGRRVPFGSAVRANLFDHRRRHFDNAGLAFSRQRTAECRRARKLRRLATNELSRPLGADRRNHWVETSLKIGQAVA